MVCIAAAVTDFEIGEQTNLIARLRVTPRTDICAVRDDFSSQLSRIFRHANAYCLDGARVHDCFPVRMYVASNSLSQI